MKAILMLADGRSFTGEAIAGQGETKGELIFNTDVVGYQEMLTDPANAGKILVLTYPLIGNYGCSPKFNESKKAWVAGLVIKEKSRIFSNWQAKFSFDAFAKEQNLFVISQIDTRTLTVHLRQKGQMPGIISTTCFEKKELLAKIEAFRKNISLSLLPKISVNRVKHLGPQKSGAKKVAVLDLGVTNSLLRQLENLRLSITVLPYQTPHQEILRFKPAGLIISSGPEQDTYLDAVVANVKELIHKLPILGISCGHQVLARALGAKVIKMRLGHHGVNYPIYNPVSYKAEITVQNHSYVVDTDSLNKIKYVKITAYNLNDRSPEELESRKLKLIGVQYIPASPGFNEVNSALKRFIKIL